VGRHGGEVQHDVRACHGAAAQAELRDAAADEADPPPHRREVLATPAREIVQYDHFLAGGDQMLDEVRADESRASCDQNSHVVLLFSYQLAPARIRPAVRGVVDCRARTTRVVMKQRRQPWHGPRGSLQYAGMDR
jgi:hypothetical protein